MVGLNAEKIVQVSKKKREKISMHMYCQLLSATCTFFKYELGSQSNQHLTVSLLYDTVETVYIITYAF